VQVLDVESSIIIVYLRTKFVSERGRKIDAPRYVLLLTYKKIMKKFLVFFLFYFLSLSLFFLETFQYDKRGPSYIFICAKIQSSSRLVSTTQYWCSKIL